MLTKIVTLIGGVIGVSSAISVMIGVGEIRSGMSNDDSRTLDKGIIKVVVGLVVMAALAGIVAYIIIQVNAIKF